MKFAFFGTNLVPIHSKSLEERALGGTETGLIRISEELSAMGHDVTIFTKMENPPASNPRYLPLSEVERHPPVDFFISIRDWIPLFYKIPTRFRMIWTGDSYDVFSNYGMGDGRVINQCDRLLGVSQWQLERISETSGFPLHKTWVIGNGIHPPYFVGSEKRERKRLIYSSTPHRGLQFVPKLITKLRERHPTLEIHIFSSYKTYDIQGFLDLDPLIEEIKNTPGCVLHESVMQKELAREFMKSSIWFYPTHFEETSCITAMEAMAAGCVPLTSKLAALPETIADAGLLIEGNPLQQNYETHFLEACDRLLSDEAYWRELSEKAKARSEQLTWQRRAQKFAEFCESALKIEANRQLR